MPKGAYAAVRYDRLPSVSDLRIEFGGDFAACYYPDFRGGYLVEIATQYPDESPWTEWHRVHCLDFFVDSFLEAGGVCLADGQHVHLDPLSPGTRKALGFLTHVLDDVDVSHPLAIHAADFAPQ